MVSLPAHAKTDLPVVTIKRADGLVHFNKAAAALLPDAGTGVDLLSPLTSAVGWKLDTRPGAQGVLLAGPGHTKRFRAQARLWLLFAGYPPERQALRFQLEPDPRYGDLWLLRTMD